MRIQICCEVFDVTGFAETVIRSARVAQRICSPGDGLSNLGDKVRLDTLWEVWRVGRFPEFDLAGFKRRIFNDDVVYQCLAREDWINDENREAMRRAEFNTGISLYHWFRVPQAA